MNVGQEREHVKPVRVLLRFLPGSNGAAFARVSQGDHKLGSAALASRIARILRVLGDARQIDAAAGMDPAEQGWRSRSEIAARVGELTSWSLSVQSVSSYVSDLVKSLAPLLQMAGDDIQLVERRPMFGIRLSMDIELEIEDVVPPPEC
jgi:hypothetical protein